MHNVLFSSLNDSGYLNKCKLIATLGPKGTSSENTAFFLEKTIQGATVKLFDSYEEASDFVACTSQSILLVANAYREINKFYISSEVQAIAAFFLNTPPYAIAAKESFELQDTNVINVASHQAPSHLVRQLLPKNKCIVLDASSTSKAAKMVSSKSADACLTNITACKNEGLVFKTDEVNIKMLWTIFISKR
jgi:prephenate dehydratase